jgi:hypothetical protein
MKDMKTNLSFVLFNINLIAKHNKGEVLRVMWACLDKEFVPPTVKRFKRLCTVDVIYKDTTVRSTIKCHSQGLEAFLSCRIPKLFKIIRCRAQTKAIVYLPAS